VQPSTSWRWTADLRKLPLQLRKNNLSRLLARRSEGIFISEFEHGEIGSDLFRKACEFGLEGLVSKRRHSSYHPGRSPSWIKVKNRSHPAMKRVKEAYFVEASDRGQVQ
jgi:bifunctional non-homologous end joining protein LigD